MGPGTTSEKARGKQRASPSADCAVSAEAGPSGVGVSEPLPGSLVPCTAALTCVGVQVQPRTPAAAPAAAFRLSEATGFTVEDCAEALRRAGGDPDGTVCLHWLCPPPCASRCGTLLQWDSARRGREHTPHAQPPSDPAILRCPGPSDQAWSTAC
jgi:hypothetical protein